MLTVTLPKKRFDRRQQQCPSCGRDFIQVLDEGRPDTYCRRCAKDYALYPGAFRRHRERGGGVESYRKAQREIRDRLYGNPEDEED